MGSRVLLIDHDAAAGPQLQRALETDGVACRRATTGALGMSILRQWRPDVVVVDIMLADRSGVEVCRQIREGPRTAAVGVLVVSERADEWQLVVSFEAGADDFVTKPYSLREVRLRVRALLRRSGAAPVPAVPDDLVLDAAAHRFLLRGQPIVLSPVEHVMLEFLYEHRGKALTREEIRLGTWGARAEVSDRAVDTSVKRLRRKLGDAGPRLETVRGLGYRLA